MVRVHEIGSSILPILTICMNCRECNVEMRLVPFGEPQVGAMGIPYRHEYYACPECGRLENSYSGAANDLAQDIDKKILDKLIESISVKF